MLAENIGPRHDLAPGKTSLFLLTLLDFCEDARPRDTETFEKRQRYPR